MNPSPMVFDLSVEDIVTFLAPRILSRGTDYWYGPSVARIRLVGDHLQVEIAPLPAKAVAK